MKIQAKSVMSLVFGTLMVISAPITACAQDESVLRGLTAATTEVVHQIAKELKIELRTARDQTPQPRRTRRSPSVEVTDLAPVAAQDDYVVVVEASRLPALDTVTAQAAH
jgi:hypothetical protein